LNYNELIQTYQPLNKFKLFKRLSLDHVVVPAMWNTSSIK